MKIKNPIRILCFPTLLACFSLHAQTGTADTILQTATVLLHVSNKDGRYQVAINKFRIHDGAYKGDKVPGYTPSEGDLLCLVLNGDRQTLHSQLISNPLHIRLEYPQDDGTIGSTVLEKTENEVPVRFNYRPEMKLLQVRKFEADGRSTEIATVPLLLK